MRELLQLPLSYCLLAIIMGGMVTLGLFIDDYYSTAFPHEEVKEMEEKTEGFDHLFKILQGKSIHHSINLNFFGK